MDIDKVRRYLTLREICERDSTPPGEKASAQARLDELMSTCPNIERTAKRVVETLESEGAETQTRPTNDDVMGALRRITDPSSDWVTRFRAALDLGVQTYEKAAGDDLSMPLELGKIGVTLKRNRWAEHVLVVRFGDMRPATIQTVMHQVEKRLRTRT